MPAGSSADKVLARWRFALGRAPSVKELADFLSIRVNSVEEALIELDGHFVTGIKLEKGTHKILFAWPFSSRDHGIRVTLEGAEEAFARCAVDALGMSSMFKNCAVITATTPVYKKVLRMKIDGERLLEGNWF